MYGYNVQIKQSEVVIWFDSHFFPPASTATWLTALHLLYVQELMQLKHFNLIALC